MPVRGGRVHIGERPDCSATGCDDDNAGGAGGPAGVVAVIIVSLTTVTPVTYASPMVTAVAPVKPLPVMVTVVPPVAGPDIGETCVTIGIEVVTV